MTSASPTTRTRPHDDPGTERWVPAGSLDEIRGDGPHPIAADGVDLVLLRTRAGLRVYEGRCPHQGALLGEGELDAGALVCRNHRWRFDAETGERLGGKACLRACPTRDEGGQLWVDVGALARTGPRAQATRAIDDLPGPRGLPVLGNMLSVDMEHLHEALEKWHAEHGPMFRVRFGSRNLVVISDPKLAEPLYRGRPDTFRRFRNVEPVFEELRMAGVFSAEGEAWRAQRRLAMEALSQRYLRGFYPTLAMVAGRFLRRWNEAADSGRTLDVADEFKRFTVDVTTLLVFGHDLNTLDRGDEDVLQRHLEHVFPALNRRLRAPFPYWRYVRLPADRRLDRALREVHAWLTSVIDGARRRLAADPERAGKPANFIEAMLSARDAEGRPFTDDVIFGNALTMLLAGEDTTAYTLAWAVHHLCDSPSAAAALRKEADTVMGDAEVPADLEHANRLTYAVAVGNEAMRLRPVVPIFSFEPLEDVVVGDVAIPRGTPIVMLSRIATREAARFDRPLEFAPERWVEAGAGGKAHDAAVHVPFGSGPRICPGRTLAILEMRVALATIYKSFDVERVGSTAEVTEVLAFTMAPRGLHVRLHRRPS